MFKKFGKFLIGIILLPACLAFTRGYIECISVLKSISYNQKFFLYGFLLYLLIHLVFRKPLKIYVFGHELTHAIWAKIFGGQVKDLKVSEKGGEVKTTKSNFIITLSPYFFPIYTLIVLIVYWITSFFLNNYQTYSPYFLAVMGFTLSFHILLTLEMITTDQPDIKEQGFVFSICLIYFINLITISALSKMVFYNEFIYSEFISISMKESQKIYVLIYNHISNATIVCINYLKNLNYNFKFPSKLK